MTSIIDVSLERELARNFHTPYQAPPSLQVQITNRENMGIVWAGRNAIENMEGNGTITRELLRITCTPLRASAQNVTFKAPKRWSVLVLVGH